MAPTIWDIGSLETDKNLTLGVNLGHRGMKMSKSQFFSLSRLLTKDDLLYLFYYQQCIIWVKRGKSSLFHCVSKLLVSNTFIFDYRTHAVQGLGLVCHVFLSIHSAFVCTISLNSFPPSFYNKLKHQPWNFPKE